MKPSALLFSSFIFAATSFAESPKPPAIADSKSYLTEVSRFCQDNWPKSALANIVCQGHSVPAGYFKTPEVDSYNAYPNLLRSGLVKRFHHAVINVIVSAVSGETSEAGAGRFDKDALACNPQVVTIDYALNDRYIEKDPKVCLDRAKRAWSSMIERAQAKGIKVILLTPTGDLSAAMDDPNDPLNLHAQQIRALAAQYHTGLVDSLAAFKEFKKSGGNMETLMAQFNHPNRQGHELVANELLKWFP